MASITQDLRFKQAVIEYSFKHGVTQTARSSEYAHGGGAEADRYFLRRNPSEGLVVLWVKLKRRGYARSLSSLYRVMQREGYFAEKSKKKPKYISKPYTQMKYPGEKVQVDTKSVPLRYT